MTAVIRADGLGKRYRRTWALRDCTLAIPAGRVAGLVGPNGAGKTTLLRLAVGLLGPACGTISVLGQDPAAGPAQLARVGFVAQDTPVYARMSVAGHLRLGAWLNPAWDDKLARRRIAQAGLDPRQRAASLSGGQRAQLALTLALAKRPEGGGGGGWCWGGGARPRERVCVSTAPSLRRVAFALGVTAGVLIRRTVPAMAATLATFLFIQIAWPIWLRPHLIPPATKFIALTAANIAHADLAVGPGGSTILVPRLASMTGDWMISTRNIGPAGHPFNLNTVGACQGNTPRACNDALSSLHLRAVLAYQPASRFWALQWYETGIFLAAALVLAGFCFWWIRRRRLG